MGSRLMVIINERRL
jgi:zinc-ribbon domain